MNPLLYAKGGDVTAWRSTEDFIAAYHQALLERAASDLSGGAEAVLDETSASIEAAITTQRHLLTRLDSLTEELSATAPAADLMELALSFYSDLYRHFGTFHSVPAFYQLSMRFLSRASTAIIARAMEHLGPVAAILPEMALIAVGPAGRSEYSPFCQLQLLLVHDKASGPQLEGIDLFCQALHAGFEAAGLAIDPAVTPRNAEWRGSLDDWQQRCTGSLLPQSGEELFNFYRLVDQYPLSSADRLAREFRQTSSTALSGNRLAVSNLIERMASLSNGLSLMGRLKLERSGKDRGLFRLLENGLHPFSAALSALALVKKIEADGNCERILGLLRLGELDVEMAERMLETWHTLHDLRLLREQSFQIGTLTSEVACLDPDKLTAGQLHSLKEALESVAAIQRHVDITFTGMGE
jgi:CBS domain-containing protein